MSKSQYISDGIAFHIAIETAKTMDWFVQPALYVSRNKPTLVGLNKERDYVKVRVEFYHGDSIYRVLVILDASNSPRGRWHSAKIYALDPMIQDKVSIGTAQIQDKSEDETFFTPYVHMGEMVRMYQTVNESMAKMMGIN